MKQIFYFLLLLAYLFVSPSRVLAQKSLYKKATRVVKEAYDDTRKQIDRSIKDVGNAPRKTAKEAERVYDKEKRRREDDTSDGPVMIITESSEFEFLYNTDEGSVYIAKYKIKVGYYCHDCVVSSSKQYMTVPKNSKFQIGRFDRIFDVKRLE